jgi:hypothetical protein
MVGMDLALVDWSRAQFALTAMYPLAFCAPFIRHCAYNCHICN